jgi:hypothetical protein
MPTHCSSTHNRTKRGFLNHTAVILPWPNMVKLFNTITSL